MIDHWPGPSDLGAALGSGTSDGYYEEVRVSPILGRGANECWAGPALNFGERRACELRRICLPRTWVNSVGWSASMETARQGGPRVLGREATPAIPAQGVTP